MFRVARNLKKEEMDFKQYFTEVEKAMRNVSRRPAKKNTATGWRSTPWLLSGIIED